MGEENKYQKSEFNKSISSNHWYLFSHCAISLILNVPYLTMSPISLILVASLALLGFHSVTTSPLESGLANGLQNVQDRIPPPTLTAPANCNDEPDSMNGPKHPKGCAGAVWTDGSSSEYYCHGGNGGFRWWGKCCKFQ